MIQSIREQNSLLVLSEIINQYTISRAKISENTGLNKATVSEIVKQLITDHYVIETGAGTSTPSGGRKPIMLTLNQQAGVAVSFDIRYNRLSYLVTYLNGEKIERHSREIEVNKHTVIPLISEVYKALHERYSDLPFSIIGVTASIHGIVDQNHILLTPYFDLDEIELAEKLQEHLQIPVFIENEANLAALAELSFNPYRSHLISFSAHTGIGAGIILDQQLYKGFKGRAGEVGHTVLYPEGKLCPCGNHGCFEQYCSVTAFVNRMQTLKKDHTLSLDSIAVLYRNNDSQTQQFLNQYSKEVAIGLTNLIGLYDPQIVYLNSEIFELFPDSLERIDQYIQQTIYKDVSVLPSQLGSDASLYGGAVLCLKNYFKVETFAFPQSTA